MRTRLGFPALIAAATLAAASPALACFPRDPNIVPASPGEVQDGLLLNQQSLWDVSPVIYLGRLSRVTWASEEGPTPRDMSVDIQITPVAALKGRLPRASGTGEWLVCEPQTPARETWREGALVVVYARRPPIFSRGADGGDALAFYLVDDVVDPRLVDSMRGHLAHLRSVEPE